MRTVETSMESNAAGSIEAGTAIIAGVSARRELLRDAGWIADAMQTCLLTSRHVTKQIRAQARAVLGSDRPAGKASIYSRGVRIHFGISIVLISVLPMLTLGYIALGDPPQSARFLALAFTAPMVVLGYFLLARYPMALAQLRDYLKRVVSGEIPDAVRLVDGETDLAAIERYFNMVIQDMKRKVSTIEDQKKKLVEIERRNAMTISLATACHYVGQPSTIISGYLDLMEREPMSPMMRTMVRECKAAVDRIVQTLRRFNLMEAYTTEPYIKSDCETANDECGEKILKVEGL